MAQWWYKPVLVETRQTGARLVISNVERATEYLLNEWPTLEDGKAYHAGKKALLAAHDGKMDAEEARTAFIAALNEGDIISLMNEITTGTTFRCSASIGSNRIRGVFGPGEALGQLIKTGKLSLVWLSQQIESSRNLNWRQSQKIRTENRRTCATLPSWEPFGRRLH